MRQYGRFALVGAAIIAAASLVPGLGPTAAEAAITSSAYTPDPDWWVTNGRVTDIVSSGNRVYVAGGFDYLGPSTGYGVAIDPASGARSSSWPFINGPVDASAADGAGGWYIAGRFTRVGGAFRPATAHIAADGTVTQWNPRPTGSVLALATTPQTVILGGDFSAMGTGATPTARLAAVDREVGTVMSSFGFSANAAVRTVVPQGDSLFVAGDFTTVNGTPRAGIAKVDLTGALDNSFAGEVRGSVRAAALSRTGSTLYVGGEFASVSANGTSLSRSRLAAFATDTGMPSGWAPLADGAVTTMAADPDTDTIFVGGPFSTVAGVSRLRLAGLTSAGVVTSFNPGLNGCHMRHTTGYAHVNPPCSSGVSALTVHDGVLYVGGRFGRSGTVTRHDAAAYQTRSGALTEWNPMAGDRINTIAASPTGLFLGGEFTSVNGQVRRGVAALNALTGRLDPTLAADTNNTVLDIALSSDGSRLYLAGSFTSVQGQPRSKLAAVLLGTGVVDPGFRPTFNNDVFSIAQAQGALYAGGQFTTVSGVARLHAVKLSGSTGAVVTTFRADTVGPTGALQGGGMVESLVVSPDGAKVFLGGPFHTVNGRSTPGGLAVVYGSTGAIYPRQLGGVGRCATVGPWIKHLYLSDDGKRLYGGDVCPDNIYRWDAVNLATSTNPTGLVWRTWCNGGMQGALEVGARFFFGGHGNTCQVSPWNATRLTRLRFAVFDVGNGVLAADNPAFNSAMGIWAIGATPAGLLLGGDFTEASGSVRQGLAFMPFAQ
jgi:hypothetical protein